MKASVFDKKIHTLRATSNETAEQWVVLTAKGALNETAELIRRGGQFLASYEGFELSRRGRYNKIIPLLQ